MYVLPVAAKIDSTRTRLASERYETQAQTVNKITVSFIASFRTPVMRLRITAILDFVHRPVF
jgi:hypothetical protein